MKILTEGPLCIFLTLGNHFNQRWDVFMSKTEFCPDCERRLLRDTHDYIYRFCPSCMTSFTSMPTLRSRYREYPALPIDYTSLEVIFGCAAHLTLELGYDLVASSEIGTKWEERADSYFVV